MFVLITYVPKITTRTVVARQGAVICDSVIAKFCVDLFQTQTEKEKKAMSLFLSKQKM